MNDSAHTDHPDDLLSLHALHALEPAEAELVEAHLERCARCQRLLAAELGTAVTLAQMVPQEAAPAALQARVMQAVADTERQSRGARQSSQQGQSRVRWTRWTRLLLPVAASLVVVALGASLVVQQFTATRLARLERENQALAGRLSQALATAAQERETVGQLRAANYMIADPTTHRMPLEPVNNGDSPYHGVLLVSEDGRHAVLMVAGMSPPSSSEDYQESYPVWLLRPGKRVIIGEVKVDTTGWGSANLAPQESVFGFDWVALSTGQGTEASPSAGNMLLRTRITASGPNR